jgi:hypothetical protein
MGTRRSLGIHFQASKPRRVCEDQPMSGSRGNHLLNTSAVERRNDMSTPRDRWEPVEVEELVKIPIIDGDAVAETVRVKVKGYRNPDEGEVYFDHDTLARLDKIKARRMGLLRPMRFANCGRRLDLLKTNYPTYFRLDRKHILDGKQGVSGQADP